MVIAALIIGLLVFMVLGVPVSFALLGISTLLLVVFYGPTQLFILIGSFTNMIQNEVLLSIPFFILMASFLQLSGIGSDIYETMNKWLGSLKGGLAMATVAATALIAAMSGVAATGTISMGLIALPEMLKRGYNKILAAGPIMAGGALGPIIPPSTVMIIAGAYSGVSTGKLFIGGVLPGILLALAFILYIAVKCHLQPKLAPVIPKEERPNLKEKLISLSKVIAPLMIIILVLGSIYAGIATPTEAAGVGAFAAFTYTIIKRRLSFEGLKNAAWQTTVSSVMLLWIMFGGSAYSSLVNITRMGESISSFVNMINLGPTGLLFAIIVIVAILGMFIEATAIIMITVPIFVPLVNMVGLDLFFVMLIYCITICFGMLTPPFGVNIFYLKGVTPEGITLGDLYKAALPYCVIIFVMILIFAFIMPDLLMWLPNRMLG